MSWFSFKERVQFLWHSKNAHGLHSPFVFAFYNAVKKLEKSSSKVSLKSVDFSKKEIRLLLAIIHHLKPASTLIISAKETSNYKSFFSKETKLVYSKSFNELLNKGLKHDMIILSNEHSISREEFLANIQPLINNESVVIIPHIHASKEAETKWKSLLEEKSIRISMDLFFVGLIFFRKESTKQDFLLRF